VENSNNFTQGDYVIPCTSIGYGCVPIAKQTILEEYSTASHKLPTLWKVLLSLLHHFSLFFLLLFQLYIFNVLFYFLYSFEFLARVMSYKRYQEIKRCFHLRSNLGRQAYPKESGEYRLWQCAEFMNMLRNNFKKYYAPGNEVPCLCFYVFIFFILLL
jgi:hypothetical protein